MQADTVLLKATPFVLHLSRVVVLIMLGGLQVSFIEISKASRVSVRVFIWKKDFDFCVTNILHTFIAPTLVVLPLHERFVLSPPPD